MTLIKSLKKGLKIIYNDFWYKQRAKLLPAKPINLNLLVNDVCNSRCQMCLIWQNKKDKEISPDELSNVLSNSLFNKLKYIGVSGGEPTLRSDLPELFKSICTKKPKIHGTGIITNGIIENVVKERILECAEICNFYGVSFSVMLSLDGLGEVHDLVRGRKNNFDSTRSLLDFFHNETNIPTSFGCTITASNALYIDELLDYVQAEGLYGRFRVAEYIERLYNSGQTEFIRAFDDRTAYHLGLFFFRAEHSFESNPTYKKTYRNIRAMLAEGKPRQIGCPYQSSAAVLTSRGDLLYCAPKSPILGNTLKTSASKIYFSNLDKRKKIIEKDCSNCIHDYHEPITTKDLWFKVLQSFRSKTYNCQTLINQAHKLINSSHIDCEISKLSSKSVLIVGWYGTETAGDKAILWTIINKLRSRDNPPDKIYLSSLYPFVSNWTVQEMGLEKISIVETYSREFEQTCNIVDEIVVGGGPLMDIEPLNHILYAFIKGTQQNAIKRVEGCGIGPLSSPIYTSVVSEILRLANHISLRDNASREKCLHKFSMSQAEIVPDPATHYVQYIKEKTNLLEEGTPPLGLTKNICCFLREWGKDYAGHLSQSEYENLKQKFEAELAKMIAFIGESQEANIHLLPMHCFHIGGDDRVFNRYIAKCISSKLEKGKHKLKADFVREPTSPLQNLQSMYHAKFNICMRFHSVLFAENLGIPYLAIDYTQGGKIKSFLQDKGKINRLISLQDIASGNWNNILEKLLYSL